MWYSYPRNVSRTLATMPRRTPAPSPRTSQAQRRRDFRKALVDEGVTLSAFARQRLKVTRQHLSRAFTAPDMVATRIHAAIDALIAKHTGGPR